MSATKHRLQPAAAGVMMTRSGAMVDDAESQRRDAESAMKGMTRALVIGILLAVLVSCAGSPTAPSEADIAGVVWKLRSMQRQGASTIEITAPERFTVEFGDDRRTAVRADCNVCTGQYELTGSNLHVGPLACTKAFCGSGSPDTNFLHALSFAMSASRSGRAMTVVAADFVLVFER